MTKDCLRVVQTSLDTNNEMALQGTRFFGTSRRESTDWIARSQEEIDDLTVLSLCAIFERRIITLVQGKGRGILEEPPLDLSEQVHAKFVDAVERWRIDDFISLLERYVGRDLSKDTRSVVAYRNWVAHRNPKRQPEKKTEPQTAYDVLTQFLDRIREL
ncbi:MAG: hypothetical protein FJ280_00275 [Planctomycetes bacterium]|nr:hypothetical protein [Planctomycetota bacterium]